MKLVDKATKINIVSLKTFSLRSLITKSMISLNLSYLSEATVAIFRDF